MADIIGTNVAWPGYSAGNATKASSKGGNLGKDDFLKLMMAQMQNQDPLSPMDNTQMVAQMAQFTSVEQLVNISEQLTAMSQSLGNNSGLIGKQVSWTAQTKTGDYSLETGQAEVITVKESGIVDSIVVRSGVHYVKVGDKEIPIDQIVQVDNPPEPEVPEVPEVPGDTNDAGEAGES
ncbi:flagellar hook assembly protein FlgD [Paenibacillus segetis]|uniref:Flagellar hook capping protein n=1 Tax=Paenibacillus segetis TaxID=1325360 RepID=A0ABQ1Y9C4_9BACL|nr:flagellar hook capping FlgD N-terminal domain-containing protein [Paenibacillus segetis]GGH17629.1 flagellar hook capping protein [Paenibacillus segetis]